MKTIVFCFAVSTCCASMPVMAEDGEALITYRQSAMQVMRWNLKSLQRQSKMAPDAFDVATAKASAQALSALALTPLESLFPAGTAAGQAVPATRLKPVYFEQPGDVAERFARFREQARALQGWSMDDGAQATLGPRLKALLDACKACHKAYREKR